ncbi:unnamed protein product [Protopolystoma xenopodis]|uniref:Uncharacterized protein n=1 Tax=Protopolystoma xenopodis TaxID=117903 RepID=A0A448X1V5_9PLAT|nr:unnamed protein product [Protopolystoma xenopodis]
MIGPIVKSVYGQIIASTPPLALRPAPKPHIHYAFEVDSRWPREDRRKRRASASGLVYCRLGDCSIRMCGKSYQGLYQVKSTLKSNGRNLKRPNSKLLTNRQKTYKQACL